MRPWGPALGMVVLSGFAAWAEQQSIVSIEAGQDRLVAEAAQILTVRLKPTWTGQSVVVTLDPGLRAALQELTQAHVHEEIVIKVCGQVVSRPTLSGPVRDGVFVISGDDKAKAKRLAQVLQAKGCDEAPSA